MTSCEKLRQRYITNLLHEGGKHASHVLLQLRIPSEHRVTLNDRIGHVGVGRHGLHHRLDVRCLHHVGEKLRIRLDLTHHALHAWRVEHA